MIVVWHNERERYEAVSSYLEKHIPKAERWRWDAASKRWWTRNEDFARRLASYAQGEAVLRLSTMDEGERRMLELSTAATSDLDVPVPPGLDYLPYQRAGIAYTLQNANGTLIGDEMGLGKALAATEPVLTPTGWREIGGLQAGDSVAGSGGAPTRVTGVYPQGIRKIYRVYFSDGSWSRCDLDHLWQVQHVRNDTGKRKWRTMSLRAILDAGLIDASGNRNWRIPLLSEPAQAPYRELPLDPYLLGVLLGDGSFKNHYVMFSSNDDEIVQSVRETIPEGMRVKHIAGCDYRISSAHSGAPNSVFRALSGLDLTGLGSDDKFIPDEYLRGSIDQRLKMLRGLMDTDGYASKDGVVQFSSNSRNLVDGVVEIVHSVGGVAPLSSKISASGKVHWTATIALPDAIVPFALARKAERCQWRRKYKPTRIIASVEEDGEEDATCIEVDADDKLYVTRSHIITHNTIQAIGVVNALLGRRCDLPVQEGGGTPGMSQSAREGRDDPERCGGRRGCDPNSAPSRVLIIVPASLRLNWRAEWLRWHTGPIRPYLLDAWPLQKRANLFNSYTDDGTANKAMIVSYDSVRKWHPRIAAIEWDVLIADEAHLLRSEGTRRAKSIFGGKYHGETFQPLQARRKMFLTGTGIVNKAADLWPLVHALAPDGLGASKVDYIERYGANDRLGELHLRLRSQVMVRRLKEDVLKDLPPKRRQIILLDVPDADEILAREAEAISMAKERIERTKAEIVGLSHAEQVMRLRQCRGIAMTEISRVRKETAIRKLPQAIEHISNCLENAAKLVAFAHHHEIIDALRLEFSKVAIGFDGRTPLPERQAAVDRFQRDRSARVFVGSKAAGLGVTLTSASLGLIIELPWTAADLDQEESRLHRYGQKDPCLFQHLVIDGSIDAKMSRILIEKQAVMDAALDGKQSDVATRDILSEVLSA